MDTSSMELHKNVIRKGSKSFSMASFFFSDSEKLAAWKLYSWCRYCDDQIDEASSVEEAGGRLRNLYQDVWLFNVREGVSNFQIQGMKEVVHQYQIPLKYPLDLLRGMGMDVTSTRFESLRDLEDYCYCVAGTVGLMMCHVLGVRSDEALAHAVAMGKAMQLTNICRDLKEDWERGRFYIPQDWLRESSMTEKELFEKSPPLALLEFQEKLLKRADELYREGHDGLRYLSVRSAWAVMIAAKIYSEIGARIRQAPSKSLQNRTYVPKLKKVLLVFSTVLEMIPHVSACWAGGRTLRRPEKVWSMG